MKIKTLLFAGILLLTISCKKEEPKKEPFYDDIVKVGWYFNLDRPNERILVTRPDSLMVNLSIWANNQGYGFILRRYKGSVGYEVPFSTKVIRFQEITEDGKLGYVIVGDTFAGRRFFK